jgi:O-antigen biosynthesis protein WbqV
LNEILFAAEEPTKDIGIVGIVAARAYVPTRQSLQDKIARLRNAVQVGDRRAVFELLQAPEKAAS